MDALPDEGDHTEAGHRGGVGGHRGQPVRAWGPWTAMMPRAAVVSSPRWPLRPGAVLEALGITSKTLVGEPPDDDVVDHRAVGVVEEVGVLGPARRRSGGGRWTAALQAVEGVGALDPHRAQMAHIEDDRILAAGPVLGQRPLAVGQRHLPSTELDQFGPQLRWASISAVCRSGSALAAGD